MTGPRAPATGDTVAGRYQLRRQAGLGGFAVVHEAVDTVTGETVAVKHPNYQSSNDDAVVEEYFSTEADLLARIENAGGHPNVMSLRERGDDGVPYIVVEFVDGYDLDEAIDRTGVLSDSDQVRQVGIDLCDAMSFIHETEIVYRDLKPDNVVITQRDGQVTPVLIDFNTATSGDSRTETTIVGPYKPPEVADATDTDVRQGPWSDVYSVGKILLFLLRGAVPEKNGVDPRDFGADCDPYLAEIVETATRTDHEERYRNATVMQRVLEARDASPPPEATLIRQETGEQYPVYPGDTIGRQDAKATDPSIAIDDEREHVSTVQARFDVENGQWHLYDRSLNGTYVRTDRGWQRVLSAAGRERLEDLGEDPTDEHGFVPPTNHGLEAGTLVALVHPSYGITLEFRA
jgi:serine/threonine protein kinase